MANIGLDPLIKSWAPKSADHLAHVNICRAFQNFPCHDNGSRHLPLCKKVAGDLYVIHIIVTAKQSQNAFFTYVELAIITETNSGEEKEAHQTNVKHMSHQQMNSYCNSLIAAATYSFAVMATEGLIENAQAAPSTRMAGRWSDGQEILWKALARSQQILWYCLI